MKNLMAIVALSVTLTLVTTPAVADSPARERELTCTDGTVFMGEQVRMGNGSPPRLWLNVVPGGSPTAFSFHAASVTASDGTGWRARLGTMPRGWNRVTTWSSAAL